jgi:hypothetical protein
LKTNNYLGKQDENRGIILFCLILGIIFAIVLGVSFAKGSKNEKSGVSNSDEISSIVEKQLCDIDQFMIINDRLVLEGELKEEVTESIVIKLKNVQIVLKDKNGDKYEYNTDYYISTEGIKFSSIIEEENDSEIELDKINNGEYFVLLRIEYESTKSETGYKYRYYTLKNNTDINNIEYDKMNIFFDSTEKVSSFLTIENN